MNGTEATATAPPVIDAEASELAKVRKEHIDIICEWGRISKEWDEGKKEALAPIEARLSEIRKKMDALGPKPECFGMRSDMDLPECEGCRFGALCFRAMKAKGLI